MKYLLIFLVATTSLFAFGCDETEDADGGVDATVADAATDAGDPTAPAENCMMRCEAKTTECSAPPMIATSRCASICGVTPTEEQLSCVEATECADLMMSFFSMELPACSLSFGVDAGMPDDAGTEDAGVADAGTTDGGDVDGGAVDGGTADAGETDGGAADAGPPLDGGLAACDARCDTKLIDTCGAPNPDMARGQCDRLCMETTTEETISCFEGTACPTIIMSFMMGTPTPCFED